MAFKLENQTGVLIKKCARLFEQVSNYNLDKLGVTYAQTIFLIRLMETDGQSQIELAKSAGLKQPTAVRLLDRMERDGLVKRVRNPDDRRVFNFYMTTKAKKAGSKLENHANNMNEIANKSLSKNEIETLNQLVLTVIKNLQAFLESK
jgi:DNA-binding MarR family transcriptional regulator